MSRKRARTDSSSDEDEVDTPIGEEEEVEESSSEEEEDDGPSGKPAVKKRETAVAAKEKNQVSDSESGSEEETDSDSETERTVPVKNPGSSTAKSLTGTKDSAKKVTSSAKSASKKGSSETDGVAASKDAKRVKRVKRVSGEEETKKTYFQRVWTDEDEIVFLQGLIDYETKYKVSPFVDTTGFYELVKNSISFDVKKSQFTEKARAFKNKFVNNRGKARKGADPTFTKPHDRKVFQLCKIIWGDMYPESAMKVKTVKQKGKSCEDEVDAEFDAVVKSILVKSLGHFGVDDLFAQQGWSMLPSEDKKILEEQWKQLQLKDFEFYSQKSGFIHAVVTKMAKAFQPSP